jgi:hypothetical protein
VEDQFAKLFYVVTGSGPRVNPAVCSAQTLYEVQCVISTAITGDRVECGSNADPTSLKQVSVLHSTEHTKEPSRGGCGHLCPALYLVYFVL